MLTSPKGKKYIGQSIQKFEARLWQHMNSAKQGIDACPYLCRAIRKYGAENFKCEILIECEDWELDMWEIDFIIEYNTLAPNGYNLKTGGANGKPCEGTRKKMSESHRKYKDYEMKMYMSYYSKDFEGFRIVKPGCEQVILCMNSLSMDEKYELALKVLDMTPEEIKDFNSKRKLEKNKQNKRSAGPEFPLPDYVNYIPNKDGFTVRLPKKSEKKFTSKTMTKEEKYKLAIEYLNTHKL